MANIFISYSSQSKKITKTLAHDIEAIGHNAWFDQELTGGQVWWDQILTSIRSCDLFVIVLDSASLESTACMLEYHYAEDLGKPILPILISDKLSTNFLPPALSKIQFVDYRSPDRRAVLCLAKAFMSVPPAPSLPASLPIPPKAPISYFGSLTEQVYTATSLSYQEQCALVLDLRKSLQDPVTTNDTQTLLAKLRIRKDLFATIAEEIDELIKNVTKAPLVSSGNSVSKTFSSEGKPQRIDPPQNISLKMILRKRGVAAIVGAAIGTVFGATTNIFHTIGLLEIGRLVFETNPYIIFEAIIYQTREGEWFFASLIPGIGGAITGAISGTHMKVILIALAGSASVFSILAMLNFGDILFQLLIGGPAGTILGAVVGAFLKKKHGWT